MKIQVFRVSPHPSPQRGYALFSNYPLFAMVSLLFVRFLASPTSVGFKRLARHCYLLMDEEVILKAGQQAVNHFAHINPLACRFADNESDEHRRGQFGN